MCDSCLPSLPTSGKAASQRAKLMALRARRAADLPSCALSQCIEEEVRDTLREAGVSTPSALVVRVVSRKRMLFEAVRELKQRYGSSYAAEFPYLSQAILCFQQVRRQTPPPFPSHLPPCSLPTQPMPPSHLPSPHPNHLVLGRPRRILQVGGKDVCLFAMYVQEYDADCPPPNTNRVYISYVDSVRYLDSAPSGARTAVYHAILNGYLKHARDRGFLHAHLWVAPPTDAVEYIFHGRPSDGRPPMSTATLTRWYERMLDSARRRGIVASYSDLETYLQQLASVRDFPLFDGDFFPDKIQEVIERAKHPPPPPPPGARAKAKAKAVGLPRLQRSETFAIAEGMRREASGSQYAFLVASLATAGEPLNVPREKHIGPHELVDDRAHFLDLAITRHWQFDTLRRAQWSTMMILAALGGKPEVD